MTPLLQPPMMLGLNGSACLRRVSSCGADAWGWVVATSDVTLRVSSLFDFSAVYNHIFGVLSDTSRLFSLPIILSIIRVVP